MTCPECRGKGTSIYYRETARDENSVTEQKFEDICHTCHGSGRKPQTNADRIRAMNDEELAWELMTWRIETCARLNGAESPYPYTQKSILDWLKQPVKDGEDE